MDVKVENDIFTYVSGDLRRYTINLEPKTMEFQLGDLVQHKTGGMHMVVILKKQDGLIRCRWYSPATLGVQPNYGFDHQDFNVHELELVDQKSK